jgi:hypothetical protein
MSSATNRYNVRGYPPLTDAERAERHKIVTGGTTLPARGTGLKTGTARGLSGPVGLPALPTDAVSNLAPPSPEVGPPLPGFLNLTWPWLKK